MVTKQWQYGIMFGMQKTLQVIQIALSFSLVIPLHEHVNIIGKLLPIDGYFKHFNHYSSLFVELPIFVPDLINFFEDPGRSTLMAYNMFPRTRCHLNFWKHSSVRSKGTAGSC